MADKIHSTGQEAGDTPTNGEGTKPVAFPLPRPASGISHSMMLTDRLRGSTADPVLLQQLEVFWRATRDLAAGDDEMIAKLREVALDCLSTLPALSVAGIAAKLAVLLDHAVIPHGTPARGLLLTAFESAMSLADMAGSLVVATSGGQSTASDAGLLKAWTAYRAAWSAYNAFEGDGNSPEAVALWKALEEAESVLGATVATTPAGAAAQLRVLLNLMPGEEPKGGNRGAIDQVVKALETMGGGLNQTGPADDVLLDVFARWVNDNLEFEAEIDADQGKSNALGKAIDDAEMFILTAPADTPSGLVVKLIITALNIAFPGDDELDHILFGSVLPDHRNKPLWDAIDRLREIHLPSVQIHARPPVKADGEINHELRALVDEIAPVQPDEHTHLLTAAARAVVSYNGALGQLKAAAVNADICAEFAGMLRRDAEGLEEQPAEDAADPFGAAVAEFEQAAPSILPAVPSAVMVEAGAAAAGIDATAVRAVYAAMAQAHQRSAAA